MNSRTSPNNSDIITPSTLQLNICKELDMTKYKVPVLNDTIERMKQEILDDIVAGKLPVLLDSFSHLHDFVDANEYGGFCEDGFNNTLRPRFSSDNSGIDDGMPIGAVKYMNTAQASIDGWLILGQYRLDLCRYAISDFLNSKGISTSEKWMKFLPKLEEVVKL